MGKQKRLRLKTNTEDKGVIRMVKVKPILATPTLLGKDAEKIINDTYRKPTQESQRINCLAKSALAKVTLRT